MGRETSRLKGVFGAKGVESPVSRKMFGNEGADRPVSRKCFGALGAERPVSKKKNWCHGTSCLKKTSMTWDPLKMENFLRNLGHFSEILIREKMNVFNWVEHAEDRKFSKILIGNFL